MFIIIKTKNYFNYNKKNEKKKIEARIKRFGKVEANEENFKFDNYRNSLSGNFDKKDQKIEKKEKRNEGSYLFIRKANFDQIEDSNLNLDKQNIFPIKTKLNEDKKKEGFLKFELFKIIL